MRHRDWMVLLAVSLSTPMHAAGQRPAQNVAYAYRGGDAVDSRPESCRRIDGRFRCTDRVRPRRVRAGRANGFRSGRGWVRVDWDGVYMERPGRHAGGRLLNQRRLENLLGFRTVHRLRRAGRQAGIRGPLRGHWEHSRRFGAVLVVTMRGYEIARLHDYDRDGFVDSVLLKRHDGRFAQRVY